MARFEKIAPPAELLAALEADTEDDAAREAREQAARTLRARYVTRGLIALGVTFFSLFTVPVVLGFVDNDALGLVAGLSVFIAFGYGTYCLVRGFGLLGRAFGARAPPDERRRQAARGLLEALVPELAPSEATLWVVTNPVDGSRVVDKTSRPDGTWIRSHALEWLQLEAKAKDGVTWTIRAVLHLRSKTKYKRKGTRTTRRYRERIRIDLHAPASAPVPAAVGAAIERLVQARRPVGPLRLVRGRATPRRVSLELELDDRVRKERVAAARGGVFDPGAGLLGVTRAQLGTDELVLAAAAVGRLRSGPS